MEILVNGQSRQAPQGQTVRELLASLQLDPATVAIELDELILPRSHWKEKALQPGARLEIVQFVGGG
jgi:sulfur carrier protein